MVLPPGERLSVTVHFEPEGPGPHYDALLVKTSGLHAVMDAPVDLEGVFMDERIEQSVVVVEGSGTGEVEKPSAEYPRVIGGLAPAGRIAEEGESVALSAFVVHPLGVPVVHEWVARDEEGLLDDPSQAGVHWTAPQLPEGSDVYQHRLYYIGRDAAERQVYEFVEVWLVHQGTLGAPIPELVE